MEEVADGRSPDHPPDGFKLVPRDAKSKKQLELVETLLKRDDIDRVINACDAGREGELIFAYLYESVFGVAPTSPEAPKPVERLWISSMTKQAIREAFEKLRPGEQMQPLESAARARSEADWLVGMNATRAATIRGRAWVGGVVSLGGCRRRRSRSSSTGEREIQAFKPEPYWLVHASFDPRYEGLWFDRLRPRTRHAHRPGAWPRTPSGRGDRRPRSRASPARSSRSSARSSPSARSSSTTSPRCSGTPTSPLRLLRAPHAPAAQSLYEGKRRSRTRAPTPATSPAT